VVVVDHVKQSREPPVVVETALHVSEQPAQRSRPIRVVGRALRLKIVDAHVRSLMCIPTRLSEQWRHMTLAAGGFAVKEGFAARCGAGIETSGRRTRRRNRELIKLKGRQLFRHHVYGAAFVPKASLRGDRIFLRVHQTFVKESSLTLQLKIRDESIPISDGAPTAAPGVIVHSRHTERGRNQSSRRFAVWT